MYITHIEQSAHDTRALADYIATDVPFGLVLQSQEDGTDTVRTLVLTDIDPSDRFTLQCLVNELRLVDVLYVFTDEAGTHRESIEPIEFTSWVLHPYTAQRYDQSDSVYAPLHLRLLPLLRGEDAWHLVDPNTDIDVVCPTMDAVDATCHALEISDAIRPTDLVVTRAHLEQDRLVYTEEAIIGKIMYTAGRRP